MKDNPFISTEDAQSMEGTQQFIRISNNRGSATRINVPYIPPRYRSDKATEMESILRRAPTQHSDELTHGVGITLNTQFTNRETLTSCIPSNVKHICFLCRRKFRDLEHLKTHERISYKHHKMLQSSVR